jgi:hypothetical protein
MNQLSLDFEQHIPAYQLTKPAGYKGLYGFHKYWGKKPAETVRFLVEQLSEPGEVVLDPFLGSGAIVREALMCGRRMIASDLNPVAIELASLITAPPPAIEMQRAVQDIESKVRAEIDRSYPLPNGMIATHYLWHAEMGSGVNQQLVQPVRDLFGVLTLGHRLLQGNQQADLYLVLAVQFRETHVVITRLGIPYGNHRILSSSGYS